MSRFATRVLGASERLDGLDRSQVLVLIDELRQSLASHRVAEPVLTDLFALLAYLSRRELGLNPWPGQIIAARIMLGDRLAEMGTGEGKTLAIGLAAAAAALSGVPVHVLTANDYLVTRDQAQLAPLFDALQLSSATVTGNSPADARRLAYGSDITYVTAREVAFDYLKDRVTLAMADTELDWHVQALASPARDQRQTLLRGLCLAIVDEADNQMLDEATTPLILARSQPDQRMQEGCRACYALAGRLWANRDFRVLATQRRIELTEAGLARVLSGLTDLADTIHPVEGRSLVETALTALHLMRRGADYLVNDDRVTPIDEPTGRMAHGRQWTRGMHQMIELKEGLTLSDPHRVAARIHFQTLFSRYVRLCGMSGTLSEARSELAAVYRLAVWPVRARLPSRRVVHPPQLFIDADSKWAAAIRAVGLAHADGRPVLMTAESVNHAQQMSRHLSAAGLAHQVLHAGEADHESGVLREAGQQRAITVATNMAGRGADIVLDEAARACGGLLVVVCHTNRERRLDRQLFGRCARAGQPGEVIRLIALTDDTLARHLPASLSRLTRSMANREGRLPALVSRGLLHLAQGIAQSRQRRTRLKLINLTRQDERLLALAGPGE